MDEKKILDMIIYVIYLLQKILDVKNHTLLTFHAFEFLK